LGGEVRRGLVLREYRERGKTKQTRGGTGTEGGNLAAETPEGGRRKGEGGARGKENGERKKVKERYRNPLEKAAIRGVLKKKSQSRERRRPEGKNC